jgi:hypothetical protein
VWRGPALSAVEGALARERPSSLRKNSDSGGFWEGHDFSRADKSLKMDCALAPEACSLRPL